MKTIRFIALAVAATTFTAGVTGCSGSDSDATSTDESDVRTDACRAPALDAAEAEYGNDPEGTSVKTLTKGEKYRVTVGIGNDEDGAHDYYVTFASSCSSKPKVSEVPMVAPPLQSAAHAAYDKIFSEHGDEMSSSDAISAASLPSAAHKQYETWTSNGKTVCSSVVAFEVAVSGESTYAVQCTVPADSIKFDLAVYDSSGADIDEASVYHSSDVGTDGVTWQNESSYQQD
jgi:hypothetical protein